MPALATPRDSLGVWIQARAPGRLFYEAIYPELVRDVSRGRFPEMEALLRRASTPMALITLPAAIATIALSPLMIPLLLGPDFGDAPLAVVPLAMAGALSELLFWLHPTALALSRAVEHTAPPLSSSRWGLGIACAELPRE